jgi:uncharacterized protein involved in exopolysaccharide biosynthesis
MTTIKAGEPRLKRKEQGFFDTDKHKGDKMGEEVTAEELQNENSRLREKYAESEARCLWLEVITRERDELKQVLERQEGELTRRKADAIEQFFRAFAAEAELDELKRQLSELLKRMEQVKSGEKTLKQAQSELAKIKRNAKRNGKQTRNQVFCRS